MSIDIKYKYCVPNGYIEVDPKKYDQIGIEGYVKDATMHLFMKANSADSISTISINKDSFVDEENSYDSLVELNIKNIYKNGFEVKDIVDDKRYDGKRYTSFTIFGKGMQLITCLTTIGNLFIGGSILVTNEEEDKQLIKELFMRFEDVE